MLQRAGEQSGLSNIPADFGVGVGVLGRNLQVEVEGVCSLFAAQFLQAGHVWAAWIGSAREYPLQGGPGFPIVFARVVLLPTRVLRILFGFAERAAQPSLIEDTGHEKYDNGGG